MNTKKILGLAAFQILLMAGGCGKAKKAKKKRLEEIDKHIAELEKIGADIDALQSKFNKEGKSFEKSLKEAEEGLKRAEDSLQQWGKGLDDARDALDKLNGLGTHINDKNKEATELLKELESLSDAKKQWEDRHNKLKDLNEEERKLEIIRLHDEQQEIESRLKTLQSSLRASMHASSRRS